MAGSREMKVQPPAFAQENVAKSHAAMLCGVMVVLCASTGHQGDVTGCQHVLQDATCRPSHLSSYELFKTRFDICHGGVREAVAVLADHLTGCQVGQAGSL